MFIDLNSDVGESFGAWKMGDDATISSLVSSVNIACGFHGGDAKTMRHTLRLAAERNLAIGAHVSYRDLPGFGRRFIDVDPEELIDEIIYQIGALDALAKAEGVGVAYVKPHGSLGNAIFSHQAQAEAVVEAICQYNSSLPLLTATGSLALKIAEERNIRAVSEGYPDRSYMDDGSLMPRKYPGAVLDDPNVIASRALYMAQQQSIPLADGAEFSHPVESVCVHGDNFEAVTISRCVRQMLETNDIRIQPFIEPVVVS